MQLVYQIGPHDGGWAYRVNDTWSEPFHSHDAALTAARAIARRQENGDRDVVINYETENGQWVEEAIAGGDRPQTTVSDD